MLSGVQDSFLRGVLESVPKEKCSEMCSGKFPDFVPESVPDFVPESVPDSFRIFPQ